MIVINQMYQQLVNNLHKTHKNLLQVCQELGVDINEVDLATLTKQIDQCTHCNVWSKHLVPDLDDNPICSYCVKLIGL
jgi:hypothetical protein